MAAGQIRGDRRGLTVEAYLSRWELVPDGDAVQTRSSSLLPVRCRDGAPAILKLALDGEERRGGVLLDWWEGEGAARVLAREGHAVLLEHAEGPHSLSDMARDGRDDEACRILCAVAARLHAPRSKPVPDIIPLPLWFQELAPAASAHGGILARCAGTARTLLAAPREAAVLHGDLHHGNVLDFGARGWLAIDPKGLTGERGFEFANIFTNPDLADPTRPVATDPDRFARRLAVVSDAAGLEPKRLLRWILAWAGLSTVWLLADAASPAIPMRIAALAAAELDR